MMFYQCRLRLGNSETVAWIAEHGAKVGNLVELKVDDRFWRVIEVYEFALEESKLREKQANDRNALPSIESRVGA